MPGVNMKSQIREIVADGRMNGRKNAIRKGACPRGSRFTMMASANARITNGGTVYSVNCSVCHNEDQNSFLDSISR